VLGGEHNQNRHRQDLLYSGDLAELTKGPKAQLDDEDIGVADGAVLDGDVVDRLDRNARQGESVGQALGDALGVYGGDHRIGR
jgi:hypothetical protein